MKKLIAICGPTATGKSDFAVELAKQTNGEIVSADSRQVYTGLDIGSGKITVEEMHGIPHHLLDVAEPNEAFSVVQFQTLATRAIENIIARGKTAILCGGTGFYIDAVLYGTTFPIVPPNETLRKELEQKTTEALAEQLKLLDPDRFETIDTKNKVRLVRAIEIATALGSVPQTTRELQYDVEWHYLDFPDEILKERIHTRLTKRMNEGMVEEVIMLHENGVSWERLESFGLEYRYIALFLQEKIIKDEMLTQLEFAIWHYAKRQRTWFKKYMF